MFLAAKMITRIMMTPKNKKEQKMSSLLCVPPIVEITRIPKLVVDFTSVPLTERRIGAFVPMGFIGTTRRSKSFERAQMHETGIPRWQIVDSIFYYFPKYSIFSTFFYCKNSTLFTFIPRLHLVSYCIATGHTQAWHFKDTPPWLLYFLLLH